MLWECLELGIPMTQFQAARVSQLAVLEMLHHKILGLAESRGHHLLGLYGATWRALYQICPARGAGQPLLLGVSRAGFQIERRRRIEKIDLGAQIRHRNLIEESLVCSTAAYSNLSGWHRMLRGGLWPIRHAHIWKNRNAAQSGRGITVPWNLPYPRRLAPRPGWSPDAGLPPAPGRSSPAKEGGLFQQSRPAMAVDNFDTWHIGGRENADVHRA